MKSKNGQYQNTFKNVFQKLERTLWDRDVKSWEKYVGGNN